MTMSIVFMCNKQITIGLEVQMNIKTNINIKLARVIENLCYLDTVLDVKAKCHPLPG